VAGTRITSVGVVGRLDRNCAHWPDSSQPKARQQIQHHQGAARALSDLAGTVAAAAPPSLIIARAVAVEIVREAAAAATRAGSSRRHAAALTARRQANRVVVVVAVQKAGTPHATTDGLEPGRAAAFLSSLILWFYHLGLGRHTQAQVRPMSVATREGPQAGRKVWDAAAGLAGTTATRGEAAARHCPQGPIDWDRVLCEKLGPPRMCRFDPAPPLVTNY
jgi:hypothetical protein